MVLPEFHQLACLVADKHQQTAKEMPFTSTKYIAFFASEMFEPLNEFKDKFPILAKMQQPNQKIKEKIKCLRSVLANVQTDLVVS